VQEGNCVPGKGNDAGSGSPGDQFGQKKSLAKKPLKKARLFQPLSQSPTYIQTGLGKNSSK
jgi:hypothetical protein